MAKTILYNIKMGRKYLQKIEPTENYVSIGKAPIMGRRYSMKRGEVTYAFAQSSEAEANDNAVIYTFTVNVPNEKGTYSVGLDTGSKLVNKVVPEEHYVAGNKSYKLNDDPSLDGEDGLIFYLVNVRFRVDDADSEMENPQTVSADDAQRILKYYTENDGKMFRVFPSGFKNGIMES